jgi:hypothetical protein
MLTIRDPSRPTDRLIFGALTSSRSTVLRRGILQIMSIRDYPDPASNRDEHNDYPSNSLRSACDGSLMETNRMIAPRWSSFRHPLRAPKPEICPRVTFPLGMH